MSICSSAQMHERLERMRDSYFLFKKRGWLEIDALQDPWVDVSHTLIESTVKDLQARMEDLMDEINQLKSQKMQMIGKTMLLMSGGNAAQTLKLAFKAWSQDA